MLLTPAAVNVSMTRRTNKLSPRRIYKRASVESNRSGFVDESGQCFLPPKHDSVEWKKKMISKGYSFE